MSSMTYDLFGQEPFIRTASLEDISEIQDLARINHVSRIKNPQEGFTGAVYSKRVLEAIVQERLSGVLIDGAADLVGYHLMCSSEGFEQAFGTSLGEELSKYGITFKEGTFYAPQVCIDKSAKGKGYFRELIKYSITKAKQKGAKQVVVEVLSTNQRSRLACEQTGWQQVGEKQARLHEFKGAERLGEDAAVSWILYQLDIK